MKYMSSKQAKCKCKKYFGVHNHSDNTLQKRHKAIVNIRLRSSGAIPLPPLQMISCIACERKFSKYYLRLPGKLNDPFCCKILLAIEWSLLQRTPQQHWSKDYKCCWMAWTTTKNCPFPLGDLHHHLAHGSLGPPKSSSKTTFRSVQPFLHSSP